SLTATPSPSARRTGRTSTRAAPAPVSARSARRGRTGRSAVPWRCTAGHARASRRRLLPDALPDGSDVLRVGAALALVVLAAHPPRAAFATPLQRRVVRRDLDSGAAGERIPPGSALEHPFGRLGGGI